MKKSQWTLIILIAIMIGGIVRFYQIDSNGIWNDEKITISCATGFYFNDTLDTPYFTNFDYSSQHSTTNILPESFKRSGGNAFGHNFVLGLWGRIFGFEDTAIRAFSALAGIGIILLTLLFYKRYVRGNAENNSRDAALLCIFLVFSPLLVEYSQTVRAYSFATFMTLVGTLWFFRYMNRPSAGALILYIIIFLFSLSLHYFTFTVFLSHAVVLFLWRKEKLRAFNLFWKFALGGVIIGALLFPFVLDWLNIERITGANQNYSELAEAGDPENNFALPATPTNLLKGVAQYFLHIFGLSLQSYGLQIRDTLLALGIPLLAIGFFIRRNPINRWNIGLQFAAVVVSLYLVQALVLSLISGHIIPFQKLYQIFAVPFALCLLTIAILSIKSKIMKLGAIGVILILNFAGVYATWKGLPFERDKNPHLQAARSIESNYLHGDTIVLNLWSDARLMNLYFSGEREIVQVLKPDTVNPEIRHFRNGELIFESQLTDRRY